MCTIKMNKERVSSSPCQGQATHRIQCFHLLHNSAASRGGEIWVCSYATLRLHNSGYYTITLTMSNYSWSMGPLLLKHDLSDIPISVLYLFITTDGHMPISTFYSQINNDLSCTKYKIISHDSLVLPVSKEFQESLISCSQRASVLIFYMFS